MMIGTDNIDTMLPSLRAISPCHQPLVAATEFGDETGAVDSDIEAATPITAATAAVDNVLFPSVMNGMATLDTSVTDSEFGVKLLCITAQETKIMRNMIDCVPETTCDMLFVIRFITPNCGFMITEPRERTADSSNSVDHGTVFFRASFALRSGLPSTLMRHRATTPGIGGMAAPPDFSFSANPLCNTARASGSNHIRITMKNMNVTMHSRFDGGGRLARSDTALKLLNRVRSGMKNFFNIMMNDAYMTNPIRTPKRL